MRELTMNEICCVGGAVDFTSPVTLALMNNVSNATMIGRALGASFALGYVIGTWLNNSLSLSTRIVDAIY